MNIRNLLSNLLRNREAEALRAQVTDVIAQRDHIQDQHDKLIAALAYRTLGRRIDGEAKVPEMTATQAAAARMSPRDRQEAGLRRFEEQLQAEILR